MKKTYLYEIIFIGILAMGVIIFLSFNSASRLSPTKNQTGFNLIFQYGVGAKNELDTFKGVYTKDMIIDKSVKTKMNLTAKEQDNIYQKMLAIDFFNYPDKFTINPSLNEVIGTITPYESYYFKVSYNGQIKELWWDDNMTTKSNQAENLRGVIDLIKSIIVTKVEYQKLPQPKGGYL